MVFLKLEVLNSYRYNLRLRKLASCTSRFFPSKPRKYFPVFPRSKQQLGKERELKLEICHVTESLIIQKTGVVVSSQ